MYTDPEEMRAFQHREEHGYLPDDVFIPTDEDDRFDTDQAEIRTMVVESYDATNRRRWEQRLRDRITTLEALLTEHGIPVPEEN